MSKLPSIVSVDDGSSKLATLGQGKQGHLWQANLKQKLSGLSKNNSQNSRSEKGKVQNLPRPSTYKLFETNLHPLRSSTLAILGRDRPAVLTAASTLGQKRTGADSQCPFLLTKQ